MASIQPDVPTGPTTRARAKKNATGDQTPISEFETIDDQARPRTAEGDHADDQDNQDNQDNQDDNEDQANVENALGLNPEQQVLLAAIRQLGSVFTNSFRTALNTTRQSEAPEPRGSEPKANPPTEYDGNSRKKLEPFIAQCEIMFATAPRRYRTDEAKVLAAGSYLKSTPQSWFSNFFLHPIDERPDWFRNWDEFKHELRRCWGLQDPEGAAESELQRLQMTDRDHATHYISRFRAVQYRLPNWGDRNLRNAFYMNVAPRIRQQFVSAGRVPPDDLDNLILKVESFDRAYWADYETKPARDSRKPDTPKSDSPKTEKTSDKSRSDRKSRNNGSSSSSSNAKSSANTSNAKAEKSDKPEPAYKKLLGTDGKLNSEERNRRIANGLCLFCGQGKHMATDCPKRTKRENTTHARATITVTPTPSTSKASESSSD